MKEALMSKLQTFVHKFFRKIWKIYGINVSKHQFNWRLKGKGGNVLGSLCGKNQQKFVDKLSRGTRKAPELGAKIHVEAHNEKIYTTIWTFCQRSEKYYKGSK